MLTPAPRQQRLSVLLAGLAEVAAENDPAIHGLALDSRQVGQNTLFLAVPGQHADGRQFMAGAVARGAVAVAYESDSYVPEDRAINAFGIANLRDYIGVIADRFYDSPSRKLRVIGVTGTNGKTTTTHLLAQVLDTPERRCGLIGTLGGGFPGGLDPSQHTTPDAVSVQRQLAGFVEAGASTVCMEVSSHALDQARVNGVVFDIAVFTNLTRDHLDYHGDMQSYAAAKAKFFEFPQLAAAVINRDDEFGRELATRLAKRIPLVSYGFEAGDVRALAVEPSIEGLEIRVVTPQGVTTLRSPLLGRFNAANLLAVLAVLLVAGMPLAEAAARLSRAQPVSGRMERFGGNALPLVVVDYAHTPDALEKALTALREHTRGKLFCVFGCGGDRDRGKRPLMGAIAERLADAVVVTDDNPRHEDAAAIRNEIRAGMQRTPTVVADRVAAIRTALAEAAHGDIVLVAGKGHEDYQQIGGERLPYSDRDTVQALLRELT
ncbi:MAG: UDP-N-acetylmuramoyl-L-alanyl-D-glutamate--2,6-diaminopimelate ligase [Gammaproteobacteria bacterium]|nr:UDP-N-acetylmuramoyl-L-alanyl-D-glutamate--2,6-diaminopimelate ligase [Gammaproteobacteria bacterium]